MSSALRRGSLGVDRYGLDPMILSRCASAEGVDVVV